MLIAEHEIGAPLQFSNASQVSVASQRLPSLQLEPGREESQNQCGWSVVQVGSSQRGHGGWMPWHTG
ncbi:MAG TPA: hypothetical protein VH083_02885 [Myxococcales bacterium]|nr:hypothetical protein [Myxococcales bacterium]